MKQPDQPLHYARETGAHSRRSRPVLGTTLVVAAAAGYALFWASLNLFRLDVIFAWWLQVAGLLLLFLLYPGVRFLIGSRVE
jgi:hypothetical protein